MIQATRVGPPISMARSRSAGPCQVWFVPASNGTPSSALSVNERRAMPTGYVDKSDNFSLMEVFGGALLGRVRLGRLDQQFGGPQDDAQFRGGHPAQHPRLAVGA